MGAELFHASGRTDREINRFRDREIHRRTGMTKLRVAFRNFAKEIERGKERPGNKDVNKEEEIKVE